MTTIRTRPDRRTGTRETGDQETGTRETRAEETSAKETRHEHAWATESRHATSAGYVVYVRCTACGSRRVDLQGHRETPPAPLTRVVAGAS
ncbi:hypothetical protein [Promicromonospora sp. NPDC060271]|uniref:hypothetical protein n=1 Tax=Promicromonospora sp. NPDC060271 TaxID=3347089 RepID=UPI0036692069